MNFQLRVNVATYIDDKPSYQHQLDDQKVEVALHCADIVDQVFKIHCGEDAIFIWMYILSKFRLY